MTKCVRFQLETETREIILAQKTRGIFQNGGEVREVLLGDETLSIKFDNFKPSFTKEELEKAFNKTGKVASISSEVDQSTGLLHGFVQMKSLKDVQQTLSFYSNDKLAEFADFASGQRVLMSPISFILKNGAKRAFRLRVEWYTGKSDRAASLLFRDAESAADAYEKAGTIDPKLDGEDIYNEDDFTDYALSGLGVITLRRARNKKVLNLKNITQSVDEIEIESMMRTFNLDRGFISAKVHRSCDTNPLSPDNVSEEIYVEFIRQAIYEKLGIDDSQILKIDACQPKGKKMQHNLKFLDIDYRRRVDVDVADLNTARRIMRYTNSNFLPYNINSIKISATH